MVEVAKRKRSRRAETQKSKHRGHVDIVPGLLVTVEVPDSPEQPLPQLLLADSPLDSGVDGRGLEGVHRSVGSPTTPPRTCLIYAWIPTSRCPNQVAGRHARRHSSGGSLCHAATPRREGTRRVGGHATNREKDAQREKQSDIARRWRAPPAILMCVSLYRLLLCVAMRSLRHLLWRQQ